MYLLKSVYVCFYAMILVSSKYYEVELLFATTVRKYWCILVSKNIVSKSVCIVLASDEVVK